MIARAPDRRVVAEDDVVAELSALLWPHRLASDGYASVGDRASAALTRWVAAGLPRWDGGPPTYDNFEVYNFAVDSALSGADQTWARECIAGERRMVDDLPIAGTIVGRLERTLDVREEDLGGAVTVNLPLPIEDDVQRDIRVLSVSTPEGPLAWTGTPGRVTVAIAPDGRRRIVVSLRYQLTYAAHDRWREPPPLDIYLDHNQGLVRVTPSIEEAARSVARAGWNPGQRLAAIQDFYFAHMKTGYVHYDTLDSRDPLQSLLAGGWADCLTGSCLVVAMCRALGVPARVVGGYLVYPEAPALHYWAEAWTEASQWIPIDVPYSWKLAAGDRADRRWATRFMGEIDLRIKTQCLPRLFTGSPGVRMPRRWRMTQRLDGGTAEVRFHDADTARFLFADRFSFVVS